MFIVFEGPDGAGSSTQSRLLAERLETVRRPTLLTKEPTDSSPTGKLIREILQHKWSMSPEGLQLLFCADRAEHLNRQIEPALNGGQTVVCDRYFFSTLAYGSLAVNDADWLKKLNKPFRLPDITFLLKLDSKTCIQRISGRGTGFELFEQNQKLEAIIDRYDALAKEYPSIHVIDASKSINEVADEVWGVVSKKLKKSL